MARTEKGDWRLFDLLISDKGRVILIQQIHRRQGVVIFMVEQNANMALSIAGRGYVLQTGRVALADLAKNLLNNNQVRQAYLGR